MDIKPHTLSLHPEWLAILFAHKSKTRAVFRDVLGLHEVSHIAMSYISPNQSLLTLSSTPSLEYNLFNASLWQFDNTYNPIWFQRCQDAPWQSLYMPERYDELYYIKQTKPRYPLGLSMATKLGDGHMIYSIASAIDSNNTQTIFKTQQHELLQLGQYCMQQLQHLLLSNETKTPFLSQPFTKGAS